MIVHAIAGAPRSYTTGLCNILDQDRSVFVSATSHIPAILAGQVLTASDSVEYKSELVLDPKGTRRRHREMLRGSVEGWYGSKGKDVVFDKSRYWNHHAALFHRLWPDGIIICMVRDLRAIFGSIERRNLKTAENDLAGDMNAKTLASRYRALFSPENGAVGQCIHGIEDLLRRRYPFVHFMRYEDFCRSPKRHMKDLRRKLGMSKFKYDLVNIKNTSGVDVDPLHLDKFPHDGSGPLVPREESWPEYVSPDIAAQMLKDFQLYNNAFKYGQAKE